MKSILWTAVAIALGIGLFKATAKLLKFVLTVGIIAAVLFLLSSLGVF